MADSVQHKWRKTQAAITKDEFTPGRSLNQQENKDAGKFVSLDGLSVGAGPWNRLSLLPTQTLRLKGLDSHCEWCTYNRTTPDKQELSRQDGHKRQMVVM